MPPRPGHHRPIGSVTAPQRFEWHSEEPPLLGDVVLETPYEGGDPADCRRAFLLVGVVETAGRCPYKLIFERLDYDAGLAAIDAGARSWHFFKIPKTSG